MHLWLWIWRGSTWEVVSSLVSFLNQRTLISRGFLFPFAPISQSHQIRKSSFFHQWDEIESSMRGRRLEWCWPCFVPCSAVGLGIPFCKRNCLDELFLLYLFIFGVCYQDFSLCVSNSSFMCLQMPRCKLIIICEKLCMYNYVYNFLGNREV